MLLGRRKKEKEDTKKNGKKGLAKWEEVLAQEKSPPATPIPPASPPSSPQKTRTPTNTKTDTNTKTKKNDTATATTTSSSPTTSGEQKVLPKDRKKAQAVAFASLVVTTTIPSNKLDLEDDELSDGSGQNGTSKPDNWEDEALIEVVNCRPTLRAGTFEAIVKWIIFEGVKDAVSSFLITFRAYGTPLELWEAIMVVFEIINTCKLPQTKRKHLRKRLLAMLVEWIQRFSYKDFEEGKDRSLFHKLTAFVKTLPVEESNQFKLLFMRRKKTKRSSVKRQASADVLSYSDRAKVRAAVSIPNEKNALPRIAKSSEEIKVQHKRLTASNSTSMRNLQTSAPESGAVLVRKHSSPVLGSARRTNSSETLITDTNSDVLSFLSKRASGRMEAVETATPDSPSLVRDMSALRRLNSKALANQMTAMNSQTFAQIKPEEMLLQNWTRPQKAELAPTLTKLSTIFNEWSYWVSTEIILANGTDRPSVIKKYIRLLHNLYKLNNFQSMMAVLAGLNRSSISRLRPVWDRVPPKYTQMLKWIEDVMSPLGNYRNYRQLLADLRGKSPIIPYLVVFLRDLTFINDGNEETLPSLPNRRTGQVRQLPNFEKMVLLGQQILELEAYRAVPYSELRSDPELQDLLTHVFYMDDETLHKKSLEILPTLDQGTSVEMVAIAEPTDASVSEPDVPDIWKKGKLGYINNNPLLTLKRYAQANLEAEGMGMGLSLATLCEVDSTESESDESLTI